jgi:hypothetical protein
MERLEFSSMNALITGMAVYGFTIATPTPAENNKYFRNASCDDGHNIQGRMAVSPLGVRYPFAICLDPQLREVLTLWPPYSMGAYSG